MGFSQGRPIKSTAVGVYITSPNTEATEALEPKLVEVGGDFWSVFT